MNPIELTSSMKGGSYKLANYRYPAMTKERKGIIFLGFGYGDYVGRYAYFAKAFAENGYDVFGMDQVGLGHSEGIRGVQESEE